MFKLSCIIVSIMLSLLFNYPAFSAEGFKPTGYEAVTIDATSGGVSLTSAKHTNATTGRVVSDYAILMLETAKINFTIDGTAPTNTVGIPLEVGQGWVLDGYELLKGFKGFRVTGTSGTLKVLYFKRN